MKMLLGIVILSLILSNLVQAKNLELEKTVPEGSSKKHLCKVQGAVDKILKPDVWGDLWCHGFNEKHYVYFANFKTEIITIGKNKGVHFVYENVTKRMKCTNVFCKKGNGTLRSIAYSKQDALIIANNNKYAEFLKQKENQRIAEEKKRKEEEKKIAEKPKKQEPKISNEFYFKKCKIANSITGNYFINTKKNTARITWRNKAENTSGERVYRIKTVEQHQIITEIKKMSNNNMYSQYTFDANRDKVIVQWYTYGNNKYSPTGDEKIAYCDDVKDNWKDTLIAEKPKSKKDPKVTPDDDKIVPAGSGSGFFVLKDGTVITNYHVIEGCELNKVSYKGSQSEAKVLSIDKVNDIAILKTDISPQTAFAVSNEDVSLLEDVVVAGYPLGKQISSAIKTHKGVVTALAGAGDNYSYFQTDAAINQGNSGGPIINQKGNVVGIAVQTWVEEGVQGVHFGIKSSTLKTFASANGLKFLTPNNRDLSNKELGKLITESTVYVECHMTIAKIKKMLAEMENKKAFFSEHKK